MKNKTALKIFGVVLLIIAIIWFWPVAFHRPLLEDKLINNPYGDAINPPKPVQNDVLPGTVKQEPGADGYEDPVAPSNQPDPRFGGDGYEDQQPSVPVQNIACTMDAKQCPDGSYVGRQGPHCDFAPCPTK